MVRVPRLAVLLCIGFGIGPRAHAQGAIPDSLPHEITLTRQRGSLKSQLDMVVRTARAQHLTPVVDIGASWCAPGRTLDSVLRQPVLHSALQRVYLVHLDIDHWDTTLDSMGMDVATLPYLAGLDQLGTPVRPQFHLAGDSVPERLVQFFAQAARQFVQVSSSAGDSALQEVLLQPPRLTASHTANDSLLAASIHAQLVDAARYARRKRLTPILDIGADWCGACHELDARMRQPENRPLMQHVYLIHLNVDLWAAATDGLGINFRHILPYVAALDQRGEPRDVVREKGSLWDWFTSTVTVATQRFWQTSSSSDGGATH